MLTNQQNNRAISISKMLCIPTERVYHDMYNRSFSLGFSPHETANMQNFFYSQGVDKNAQISMVAAATNIGSAIKLSTIPTGKVAIPHGWSTQRLMYLLAVEEYINDTASLTHYIQGYSEYYDPSHTGKLDPNAAFFINSITTISRTKNMYTNAIDSRVLASYNVIMDPTGRVSLEQVTEPSSGVDLIRPSDVMTNLYGNTLYAGTDSIALNIKSTSISNGANVSTRSNNDPLKYFTNTVNAVVSGKCIDTGHNTPESVLSNANGMVAEQAITSNAFIYEIARLTGNLEPGSFTLEVLSRIDPSVSSKITLVNSGSLIRDMPQTTTMLDTNNTESLLNYTEDTEVAQTFINALTANMSENLITVLSGTITNIHGTPITTISNLQSFLEGVDITPYGNRIINYVNAVIMPQLTVNNLRVVSIVFDCDLLGDTTVSVSLDHAQPVVYRLPTFADSLYSPVLTNAVTKEAVIGDFEVVVDTVMGMSQNDSVGDYCGY